MVLIRPVTKTKISTETFGHPVYDWIVANTPTPWANVAFQNGYTNYGAGFQTVQYRRVGDVVQVRGMMGRGSPIDGVVFTLPVGFTPPAPFLAFMGSDVAGGSQRFDINSNGNVRIFMPANASFWNMLFSFATIA